MLAEFLQFLFSGITVGSTYALAALGFTLIYNSSHVINFAQGEFIASSTPVAVTRHGQTVGYFIPTHGQAEADVASLKKASKTLDRLLAAKGVDVDTVVAEFKTARKRPNKPKKPATVAA